MRERLADSAYALGWSAVRRLPEPAATALFRRIADTAWRQRGKGVQRLEANLRRVRPDAGEAEIRDLSRAGMRSYLRYWQESFRLPAWDADRIARSFAPEGHERIGHHLAEGRGVVLALPHMGNWDLAGAWLVSHLGHRFTTVAERLRPESLFDRFVAYREGLGMEVLPLTGGSVSVVGTLAKRLRAGGLVCLVGDRDLSANGVEVDFLGERARVPAGPAALAVQTGAALLPVTLWYDGTPVMKGIVHPEVPVPAEGSRRERSAAMTRALAAVWAEGVRSHPEDWHMLQRFWLADLPAARAFAQDPVGEPSGAPAETPAGASAGQDPSAQDSSAQDTSAQDTSGPAAAGRGEAAAR
ncbi:phosphatidylinositol mannoside acyltransferase [Streptacidiphilus sp. ASG 303]|uniref:phosphatidylinositol mannoside acyltransferase n=1 Tax=Streptacidiphilus sp. ASG 303 TaxID=2896847 RepID=UPI001E3A3535|nr:phosphatidylinositol mannoside acyltransferase [Streptacidiphilus sp. ASG 303]MCD0481237.1 phosphatidylinositol mannoside acyltransferase [Streptacidiphilus sp. ASG 303]